MAGIRPEDIDYIRETIESMVNAAQARLLGKVTDDGLVNMAFRYGRESELEDDDALAMFCVAMVMLARERIGRG
jgi:hypothetical protein